MTIENPESSVLFSLNELKQIQSGRRSAADRREAARKEAERLAREEEALRAVQAAERARYAAERAKRMAEEAERRERDHHLFRTKQVERIAEVELQTDLAQAQLALEIDAAYSRPRRGMKAALATVVAAVVFATAGLGYLLGVHLPAQRAKQDRDFRAKMERIKHDGERSRAATMADFEKRQALVQARLAEANARSVMASVEPNVVEKVKKTKKKVRRWKRIIEKDKPPKCPPGVFICGLD